MATSTVENYLKAIHHLETSGGKATVGEIASALEVTPGTVTFMMRQLSSRGLIDYTPRKAVKLLPDGEVAALKVIRRHRLIELFLVQVMQLDWSEVHEEAEILEHVVSDRLLERIDAMLGEPTHDPHGDPIPDRLGRMPVSIEKPLAEVAGGDYRVVRVSDGDADLLGWLEEKGLTIGEEFRLSHPDRAAGLLELAKPEGEVVQLGTEAAGQVFVEALTG